MRRKTRNFMLGKVGIGSTYPVSIQSMCNTATSDAAKTLAQINEVAQAIIKLASTPKECNVFHPYNIHTQFLGDILSGLDKVTQGIQFVETEQFNEAMEQAKNHPTKAKLLSSLLAYQNMAHGQKTGDVKRNNDYTTQVLYRLGFNWSPTTWDYTERMLKAIGGLGFFDIY